MIEILPESEGSLIALKIGGKLTLDDYTGVWVPRLEEAIESHGKVRVLMYLDETFDGWETGVIWEDTKVGLKNVAAFKKVALVGGPTWIGKIMELVGHLMPGSMKAFPAGSLEEAYDWIK
jgi:hypothetical protein